MKQRVSRDAAHTFPAFARKYSRGAFPFSWWFTARTCLGRCRSHNGESCRRRSPADTVITGWHLPGRDHNDNGRFAGKTSSYTLAVCTGYARAPPCSRAPSPSIALTGFLFLLLFFLPFLPRCQAIPAEPSRYVALVIRYRRRSRRRFLPEAEMYHARLIAFSARVRCSSGPLIEKQLRFFVARLSPSRKVERERQRERTKT